MDGHERTDVVEYRNNVFLPAMAKFEARMVQYEGPDSSDLSQSCSTVIEKLSRCITMSHAFTQMTFHSRHGAWLSILPKFPCK